MARPTHDLEIHAAALRKVETPSPDRARATWAAIEAEIRPRRRRWPVILAAAAVFVALVVGLREGSSLRRHSDPTPKHAPHVSTTPAGTTVPSTPRANPTAPPPSAPEPEATDIVAPPATRDTPRRPSEAPAVQPSSLAEETRLLKAIQRATELQQPARVLELTQEHAQRFPEGTFVGERTLARVRALCGLHRAADARKLADHFLARNPNSHLRPKFASSCP